MNRVSGYEHGLLFEGTLTLDTVHLIAKEARALISNHPAEVLHGDVSGLQRLDTAGAVFLRQLPDVAREAGRTLSLGPLPDQLQKFFDYVGHTPTPSAAAPLSADRHGALERLGGSLQLFGVRLSALLFLMSDLTCSAVIGLFRRTGMRRGSFVEQAIIVGSQGLPVVALILFLIGAVSTLQAAAQLRQFGANILVADLLAIGICRELGPLMTAIMVAGRSGSAIAAEIATMKFTEEIDALHTMALDPLRLVAVPKMWAMVLTVPLLTTMADLTGLAGGTLTALVALDIAPATFFDRLTDALHVKDIVTGLVKSVSFAWIITVLSVYRGLDFKGGAVGVGLATTSSVVSSIFAIIVLDLVWGMVFYLR